MSSVKKSRPNDVAGTFAWLLIEGFWPVVIYAPGEPTGPGKVSQGKNPVGKGWGAVRWTIERANKELKKVRGRGVGICLGPGRGPGELWLIDIEGDGPEAEASRAFLFGGEVVETLGWGSTRGGHRLFIVDAERLAAILPALKHLEGKGLNKGVYKSDLLPGLELRFGGYADDGEVKQMQSVVPPTLGINGKPRQWVGGLPVASAPDSFYEALERIGKVEAQKAEQKKSRPRPSVPKAFDPVPSGAKDEVARNVENYCRRALADEASVMSGTIEGGRRLAFLEITMNTAGLVQPGGLTESEYRTYLHKACEDCHFPHDEAEELIATALEKATPRDLTRARAWAVDQVGSRHGRNLQQAAPKHDAALPAPVKPVEPTPLRRYIPDEDDLPDLGPPDDDGSGDGGDGGGDLPPGGPPEPEPDRHLGQSAYFIRNGEFWTVVDGIRGPVYIRLANFIAEIVEEVSRDDGDEQSMRFVIEATRHDGARRTADVSAAKFAEMGWIGPNLGASFIVEAGAGSKDRVRAAIQHNSTNLVRKTTYAHTGWTKIDGRHAYLHSGGAITADGPAPDVSVDMGETLKRYELPAPPEGKDLVNAIRASLGLLRIYQEDRPGSMAVAAAMFSYAYRAVLGRPNHSCQLNGNTGSYKTSTSILSLQHFGSEWGIKDSIPATWESTANQLEAMLHAVKDCLLVIDDFVPDGSVRDANMIMQKAERIFRTQGNGLGRQRMAPDQTFRPMKSPRGSVISSGEDRVRRKSADARTLPVRFVPGSDDGRIVGTISVEVLTECQKDADAGLYAASMSGYVRWLASRLDDVKATHKVRSLELRPLASGLGFHARTPDIVADLVAGIEPFLLFATEAKAITEAEGEAYRDLILNGLMEAAAPLAEEESTNPADVYLRLLKAALGSGQAFLVDSLTGMKPNDLGSVCGWRKVMKANGPDRTFEDYDTTPGALKIGWTDGELVYLVPDLAYQAAQRMANAQGEALTAQKITIQKQLDESGKLARKDTSGKKRLTARITLERRQEWVLTLNSSEFWRDDPDAPAF